MKQFHLNHVLSLIALFTATPFAFSKTATHSAHVHGNAKLSIARENAKKATILLEAPGDSIFGFEHEAKGPEDKKTLQTALNTLENKITEIFSFDKAADCTLSKNKIEILKEEEHEEKHEKKHSHHNEEHGEHNEVEAEYNVSCKNNIKTLEVKLGLKFPKIKNLQVQVLKDEGQNSLELKDAKGTVKL